MSASSDQPAHRPHMALWGAAASLLTVSILIGLKAYAYWQSGSASVLASLIDSVVDAQMSLTMLLAIRLSLKPANADYRFGHGKIEGLAAVMQAALMAGAAFFLLLESLNRFQGGAAPESSSLSLMLMGATVVLSVLLVAAQKIILRFAPSLALEVDSAHYSSDIGINIGVVLVLLALSAGAPLWIDPVFAVAVAVYLGFIVRSIAMKGFDMLLDRELPEAVREDITRRVRAHPEVLGLHDLRTRASGMDVFITFDIELEASDTLRDAHDIVRRVEHDLLRAYPNADILIHADPHDDKDDTRHRVSGVHDV